MANIRKEDPLTKTVNLSMNESIYQRILKEKEFEPNQEYLSFSWFCRQLMSEAMDAREAKRLASQEAVVH